MKSASQAFRFAVVAFAVLAGSTAVAPIPAYAALPVNSCSDPYWQFTLRCEVFPGQTPQPNYNEVPTLASEIKSFTRVFLDRDLSIRSVDGTLPVIYVDRAVCTQSAGCGPGRKFGEPIPSSRWVISMPGGGSCYVDDPTIPGVYDDPTPCLTKYLNPAEIGEMSTATNDPMTNYFGINNPDPKVNREFAGYNRIRIEKSSYDRYNGRATYAAPGGAFHAGPYDFNLFQHGFDFMLETIRVLESGLRYRTWEIGPSGRVREYTERLPSLANATDVLLVGHSGGAHGLYHNIDRLADRLGYAQVRALFDANFEPGVLNEAAFGVNPVTGVPLGGDAYTNQWAGKSWAQGVPFLYDGRDFNTNDVLAEQHESWNAPLDQSCLAVHAGTEWACNDRMHVMMNHIETPMFVRQDWNDPNSEHTNGGTGYTVQWGREDAYPYCGAASPCTPVMSLPEREVRLAQQAATFLTEAGTDSELATTVDPSLGGAFPTLYVWMPDCEQHEGAYQDDQFFDVAIDAGGQQTTMSQHVELFMTAAPLNVVSYRVVGFHTPSGTPMTQAPCP